MTLEEFEIEYREELDNTLNKLQNATLLLAQIEATLLEVGRSVHKLTHKVETFIEQQEKSQFTSISNENTASEPILNSRFKPLSQAIDK